jgi:hypothetical protein
MSCAGQCMAVTAGPGSFTVKGTHLREAP